MTTVAQLFAETVAIAVRQHDIQQDQVDGRRLHELRPGFPQASRDNDAITVELEIQLQARCQMRFVLDHQHGGAQGAPRHRIAPLGHQKPSFAPSMAPTGNWMRIVVPWSRPADSARMRPPRLRTSRCTT